MEAAQRPFPPQAAGMASQKAKGCEPATMDRMGALARCLLRPPSWLFADGEQLPRRTMPTDRRVVPRSGRPRAPSGQRYRSFAGNAGVSGGDFGAILLPRVRQGTPRSDRHRAPRAGAAMSPRRMDRLPAAARYRPPPIAQARRLSIEVSSIVPLLGPRTHPGPVAPPLATHTGGLPIPLA